MSEEIMVVYAIAIFSIILGFLVYIAQKTYARRNQKHNTQELNRLVEEITEIEAQQSSMKEEVVMPLDESKVSIEKEVSSVDAIIPVAIVPEVIDVCPTPLTEKEDVKDIQVPIVEEKASEEIQYESIEPDRVVAQRELEKLTEELKKVEENVVNIELTEFEAEQEENAIISLDELLAKGDMLYEKNEVTQYQDEGNEPISLQDLEERMREKSENNVVVDIVKETPSLPEKDTLTVSEVDSQAQVQITQTSLNLDVDEANHTSKAYQANHTFKSSPVISPIYGIEGKQTELELENTATLQKFDDEIRKTNEFVMTLKELQKNLE